MLVSKLGFLEFDGHQRNDRFNHTGINYDPLDLNQFYTHHRKRKTICTRRTMVIIGIRPPENNISSQGATS